MFHRVPFISARSVAVAAVILVLAALSLGSSLHGTANAQGNDPPEVSIVSVEPSDVATEGGDVRVTLRLSRALSEDDRDRAMCYQGRPEEDQANGTYETPCIEGGIIIQDTYNDHLRDDGPILADELIKFVFRDGEDEKSISYVRVAKDDCITPGRTIRIRINRAFDEATYGYTSDNTQHTLGVDGDDETNDGTDCLPVEDGTLDLYRLPTNSNPSYADDTATRTIAENTPAGQPIGDPVTADDDGDTLTYTLGGTDAASFDIDDTNGQIKTKDALDFESDTTSYEVTVSVSDGENLYGDPDDKVDDTIDVTIEVTDVNESPVFDSNALAELEIAENTPPGQNIGSPITATDPDDVDTLTYSLDDGDGAAFEIVANGQIQTKEPLDHETKGSYSLTVTATDSGDNTATHPVTITVTDEEHEPPRFEEEYGDGESSLTREVAENTEPGQPVGAPVSATDDENDTLTYSLDDQDGAKFEIDSEGQIKVKDALDFETTPSFNVTVSVTDGEDDAGNAEPDPPTIDDTIDVTIDVTDVNEGPTFADDAPTELSVDENTATDTDITDGLYTATDPEDDTPLTYSLAGTDAASFDIDTSNGQLKTKAALDHEAKDTYNVIIEVTDGKDAAGDAETNATIDDTHSVTITVTNEDEDGTITFSSEHPRTSAELTATLSDPDGNVSSETWKWETLADGNDLWTAIPGATTSSYTPVSSDVGKRLRVTAMYEDAEGSGKEAVAAGDNAVVANNPPDFGATTATRSVAENAPSGTNIGSPVTATDTDTDDGLSYSLGGTNASSFAIVSSSGQLQTKAALDYEIKTSYSVVVTATDTSDATDTITVTINVTNVSDTSVNNGGNNNNGGSTNTKRPSGNSGGGSSYTPPPANQAPIFNDGTSTERWVAEKSPEGTDIGHPVRATDADKDSLTFSLGGTDASSFSIVTGTGQLKTKAELDFEIRDTYSVTVSVTDGQGGTDSIAVTIRVTDVVDVPVTDEDHQVVVLVDPDDETEVSTPGGNATVTFPEDTRPGPYFVLIDTSEDNCDWDSLDDPPADELQACVTIEVFDTQGNPITGDDIFDPAITIEVVLDPDDIGTGTIHSFVESGNGWTSVTFTQSTDSDGNITITIGGVTGPGTYGVGSNAVQQLRSTVIPEEPKQSEQQATVQIPPTPEPTPQPTPEPTPQPTPEPTPQSTPEPTPQPTPEPTPQPTPEPTPQPTPEPTPQPTPQPTPEPTPQPTPEPTTQPTPVPQPIPEPTPEPMATPEAQEQDQEILQQSLRVAPPDIVDLGNASGPDLPQVTFFGDAGDDILRMRLWPVILMALGIAMELIALGLFLKEKEADKRRW